MKKLNPYFLILLFIIFFNCKDNSFNSEEKYIRTEIDTLKNKDENFNVFIENFNKDSIFQLSRVRFPILITEFDSENSMELRKILITTEKYSLLNFEYPKDAQTRETNKYTQKTIFKGKSAIIEIRGIENGIFMDFRFIKINSKWFLVTWNEQST